MIRSLVTALFTAAAFVLPAGLAGLSSVSAQEIKAGPVYSVVELFTSQGCSSCPPADKLLKTYVDRPDVIALTMPVDYWDYLGWRDTFAQHAFSMRQRHYAQQRGDGQVYTPQMVINGIAHAVGSRASDIDRAINRTAKRLKDVRIPISLEISGDDVLIHAGQPTRSANGPIRVWIATVIRKGVVKIGRGENRGRNLSYHNIVKRMIPVGTWEGKPMSIRLSLKSIMPDGADMCVVLLQAGEAGPIVGAAEMILAAEDS